MAFSGQSTVLRELWRITSAGDTKDKGLSPVGARNLGYLGPVGIEMAEMDRAKTSDTNATGAPKRREELDAILQRIAEHIADVDRKQGGTGQTATGPALAMDAARKPDAQEAIDQSTPTAAAAPSRHVANATDAETDDFDDRPDPAPISRARTATSEPPALRSALKAQPAAAAAPARRVSLRDASPHLPSAVLPSSTAGAAPSDELWDRQSADALASVYDAEAGVQPLRNAFDAMSQTASKAAPTAAHSEPIRGAVSPAAASLPGLPAAAVHAEFTETNLASMARRVEAALDRLAPRDMVEALDRRFDGLAQQLATTQEQLVRLDGIESRLGEFGDKLSDDQIVALFGGLVPTAEELTQFAEDAAGRAAERVLEAYAQEMSAEHTAPPAKDSGASHEIRSLRELIGAFMDDRRRNDAGTQETLETLQLAMQHVLDRLDPLEPASEAQPANPAQDVIRTAVPPPQPMSHAAAAMVAPMAVGAAASARMAAPLPPDPLADDASFGQYDPETDLLDANQPHDLDAAENEYSFAENGREHSRSVAGGAGDGHTAALAAGLQTAGAARMRGADSPSDASPPAPTGNDRQAYIALARKAAEKAKAESDAQAAAEQGSKGLNLRAKILGGKTPAAPIAGVRPSVLIVTGLAAFLLAGYWFMSGSKIAVPGLSPSVSLQQPQGSGSSVLTGAQPDVETDEPARGRGAPAGQLPGKPDKTADEVQPGSPAEPLHEARVIDGAIQPGAIGIALDQANAPSADAILRARNQQHLANLSHRTAYTAAEQHRVATTSAGTGFDKTSTALEDNAQAITTGSVPTAPPIAPTKIELPPAPLGPLSLRVAAAKGDASAQLEIATRYAEGRGVKQNLAEAVTWYQRAAMQGLAVAQYRLATLQERGMGLKADPARARVWYQRAAEQGNLKAMHNLAVLNASPSNGTPDYDTAAKHFAEAAERGLADSQYNLAILAESGLGMQKDLVAAYKWYTLAAKAGDQDAQRRRDQLIGRLTQEMIQDGEKQLASWRPAPASTFANDARVAAEAWKQRAGKATTTSLR